MSFDQLAPAWEPTPLEQVRERFDIGEASNDSVYLEDLFGEEPEHFFVHRGDITVDGALALKGEKPTVYVIDGNLIVNGPLLFRNSDVCTSLLITGSVAVENLFCMVDCCLFVGGSLEIKSLLVTYLSDAGHLVVQGSLSAAGWLDTGGRGCVESGERHVGNAADFLLPEFSDSDAFHTYGLAGRLTEAALEGRPLLSTDSHA